MFISTRKYLPQYFIFIAWSLLLKEVTSDAVLEVLLSRFINPYRQTATSILCDNDDRQDPCETYFIFCAVNKPFLNPQNCSYGFYQTIVQGDNDISWKVGDILNKESNLTNPFQFYIPGSILQPGTSFPREAKFGLKIAVYDDDSKETIKKGNDLVDFYQFDGALIPLAKDESSANFITVFPPSIIDSYTQLRLRIRLFCAKDYYGVGCETFCTEYGNFQCSSEGVLGCKPGWGPAGNCTRPLTSCSTIPAPCRNGATCFDGTDSVTCACAQGYEGLFCERDINECASDPCENNGFCQEVRPPGFHCSCTSGYTGKLCEQILNPCESREAVCLNDGICNMTQPGNYECSCPIGYEGIHCQKEIDECNSSPCLNDGVCVDLVMGYKCVCLPTFTGDRCEREENECDKNPCQNNATCTQVSPGFFTCSCVPGYVGPRCDRKQDQCNPSPCFNGATCIQDGLASFQCLCPIGFSGLRCENANSVCATTRCENGGSCVASMARNSTPRCECRPGFIGSKCEYEANNCEYEVCPSDTSICTQKENLYLLCIDSFRGILLNNYTIEELKERLLPVVTERPFVTSKPIVTDILALPGSPLIFDCRNSPLFIPVFKKENEIVARGINIVSYSQLFADLMVKVSADNRTFSYKIEPVTPSHTGRYSCDSDGLLVKQIFNVRVEYSSSATVEINATSTVISSSAASTTTEPVDVFSNSTYSIKDLVAAEGETLRMECEGEEPRLQEFHVKSQTWKIIALGTDIKNFSPKYSGLIVGRTTGTRPSVTFKIVPVERRHAGIYACDVVQNEDGEKRQIVFLVNVTAISTSSSTKSTLTTITIANGTSVTLNSTDVDDAKTSRMTTMATETTIKETTPKTKTTKPSSLENEVAPKGRSRSSKTRTRSSVLLTVAVAIIAFT